jgi:drug/metabolite transporter (DMT)-like permease
MLLDRQPGSMGLRTAVALATVYVVWGSTYLGIVVAIRDLPPFLMLSIRFLIAGALLYAWAAFRGAKAPTMIQWRAAVVAGGGLLLIGTGGVAWAEQHVDSGVVALVVAVMPLWLALLDRQWLSPVALIGLGLGFGGVALLVGPGAGLSLAAIVVVFTSLAWAAASLYSRDSAQPSNALQGAAMQMLAGGALLGVVGLATGELSKLHAPSAASVGAIAYLVVVGSIIGFTAYMWLLRNTRMSLVGTYAFVNPIVAVLLGWLFNNEALTVRTAVAGLVIVLGVALIVLAPTRGYAESHEDLQPALGEASLR